MFQKPFRVKSQTAIKGSDRKKLRAEVGKLFTTFTVDELTEVIPMKEDMSVVKIYTHYGDNALIYCLQRNPIFFELNRRLYPTVYVLWRYPGLLPAFTTFAPVLQKMLGGADLMLPGVVIKGDCSPTMFGNLQKGDICAINLVGNRAPVAVGTAVLSGSDMYSVALRGKGVNTVHVMGDELWLFGDKSLPPELGDNDIDSETEDGATRLTKDDESSNDSPLLPGLNMLKIDDGVSIVKKMNWETTNGGGDIGEASDEKLMELGAIGGVDAENTGVDEMTKDAMDELLRSCFLGAIKLSLSKSDLPLLTSNFFRNYMIPLCPVGKHLEIKKSTYKKLSNFLQAMAANGLITVKRNAGTSVTQEITAIDKTHPEVREFIMPEFPPPGESSSTPVSVYQPPDIKEMLLASGPVLAFLKPFGYQKGSALTSVDLRKCINDYVKNNSLQNETDSGNVALDPNLADLVLGRGENNIFKLPWPDLISRIQVKMQPAYQLTFPGVPPTIHKGKIEAIKLSVVQRASNKKATCIENLEVYRISPEEFAHQVQIGVSCSTSVSPTAQKNKGLQVMVQGNQIRFISDLLMNKYKISRRNIEGLEKASKKR